MCKSKQKLRLVVSGSGGDVDLVNGRINLERELKGMGGSKGLGMPQKETS